MEVIRRGFFSLLHLHRHRGIRQWQSFQLFVNQFRLEFIFSLDRHRCHSITALNNQQSHIAIHLIELMSNRLSSVQLFNISLIVLDECLNRYQLFISYKIHGSTNQNSVFTR